MADATATSSDDERAAQPSPVPQRFVHLRLALPAATYALLAERARADSVTAEALAAALLVTGLVRCTAEEHGPELAGEVLTVSELAAINQGRAAWKLSVTEAALHRLRAEQRRTSSSLMTMTEAAEREG